MQCIKSDEMKFKREEKYCVLMWMSSRERIGMTKLPHCTQILLLTLLVVECELSYSLFSVHFLIGETWLI